MVGDTRDCSAHGRRNNGRRNNGRRMMMVAREWLLVWCLAGAACGRIGFDPFDPFGAGAGDASGDGVGSDDTMEDPLPLSCSSLASTCGLAGTSPCCGSPLVPSGTFYRSYDFG